jgi:predicted dehydrogenase
MQAVRVGLIGSGHWARAVHGANVVQHPRAELVGVWGRDPARTGDAAAELGTRAYADIAALLDDVDTLTFAVPPDVQARLAVQAAERGRHLLLEKPVATSVADARRMEQAVGQAHVASVVFFTRRFVPEIVAWLDKLNAEGGWDCGRAEVAASIFRPGNPFGASAWRRDKGALWDIGPHALSVLCAVLGDVTEVLAGGGRGDQVHLVLGHAGGGSSTASLSLTVPGPAIGSSTYFYGAAGREVAPERMLGRAGEVAAHQRALDALLAQIDQPGSGHPCDVRFGARVVEVLAAAERSLAEGRKVVVDRSP